MRVLSALLLGAATLLVPGCLNSHPEYEVAVEASGAPGATADATFSLPKPNARSTEKITLPFRRAFVNEHGAISFRVVPSKGAAACRIVIEGKQLAAVHGRAGEPVECALPANLKWPTP